MWCFLSTLISILDEHAISFVVPSVSRIDSRKHSISSALSMKSWHCSANKHFAVLSQTNNHKHAWLHVRIDWAVKGIEDLLQVRFPQRFTNAYKAQLMMVDISTCTALMFSHNQWISGQSTQTTFSFIYLKNRKQLYLQK